MRQRNRSTTELVVGDDSGSAALEFIVAGMVLLVPIVYLIVAMGQIQSHALGVETAARQVARVIATSTDGDDADAATARALVAVAEEYGIESHDIDVAISCSPAGANCPVAGAIVRVTVTARAPLPLVPPVLGLRDVSRVAVEATSSQKVSRTWVG